jgi:hypothetical protein
MNALSAFVTRHLDAVMIGITIVTLLATIGWAYVLRRLHRNLQGWYLSLPKCPDCDGRGTFGGLDRLDRRASCPRCDGFGRIKTESLRETVK